MNNLEDSYKAKGLRRQLVKEIEGKGIKSATVLSAIGKMPRHVFFDSIFLEHAYEDKAFPIGEKQTISQPYTVAFQTELLNVSKGDKILEIGTGSGYQAAILLELGAEVFTIEYNQKLFQKTMDFLPKLGYNPHFFQGDGSLGLPKHAPYDSIVVTAGAPNVPDTLIKQLKIGGVLVIPVGDQKQQKMIAIKKLSQNKASKKEFSHFSFVPLLGKDGW
ncbi:protein-L-isoaspartate(D-aspartate) O-methyltransferase [Cyclobacteriaceae bacterium]|jgi:protein-L-isoaspartate(D-aspartate) O-methyltransferase|nr:protein-L-isoaspartate(D-aspartate) O-methyltransferase [Cyclobacteriaceae bacterium]MDB9939576.1 protein-L-isoaspartate(D-aspartate) O-methyltransferase [Cyclobacteriaceae bacterium]|tara:strand:- start:687 stop:1340 length:654 start_codon:yes stop_codon:yes gene_type:complete